MKTSGNLASRVILAGMLTLFMLLFVLCACTVKNSGGVETDITVTDTESVSTPENQTDAQTGAQTTAESKTETETNGIIIRNDALVYSYTADQYNAMKGKVDRLWALIQSNKPENQEEFLSLYEDVEDKEYATLQDQYLIAEVLSMVYLNDTVRADNFAQISEMYHEMLKELIMMYDDIYDSVYRDAFYKDWKPEEIEQAVRMAKEYTDTLSALKTEYDAIKTEFYALSGNTFLKDSAALYMRAVELNKKIAAEAGFENYMDYAYRTSYGREYTPADVQQMREYVKQYIVPQIRVLYERVQVMIQNMSTEDYLAYDKFMNSELQHMGVVDGYGEMNESLHRVLDEYYSAMGGDMRKAYYDMWSENRFIISSNGDNSRSGAFSVYFDTLGYPLFYFGPGYQNMYTVIHEFGHCYAMELSATGDMPIDLAEVHSQGNEWLFTSFIRKEMSHSAYELIADYRLFSDFCSIANCVAVDAFEQYVYTHDDYTADDLDGIMADIMKDMGIYDIFTEIYAAPVSYWHYVTTDNPAYYISYAMSMVPSLSLYAMSLDDFDAAAEAYRNISLVGEYDTFLDTLKRASISSPFDEETYKQLAGLIKKVNELN